MKKPGIKTLREAHEEFEKVEAEVKQVHTDLCVTQARLHSANQEMETTAAEAQFVRELLAEVAKVPETVLNQQSADVTSELQTRLSAASKVLSEKSLLIYSNDVEKDRLRLKLDRLCPRLEELRPNNDAFEKTWKFYATLWLWSLLAMIVAVVASTCWAAKAPAAPLLLPLTPFIVVSATSMWLLLQIDRLKGEWWCRWF